MQPAYRSVRLHVCLQAAANLRVVLRERLSRVRFDDLMRDMLEEVQAADRERLAQRNPLARGHNELMRECAHAIDVFDTADTVLIDAYYANATNETKRMQAAHDMQQTLKKCCQHLNMFGLCAAVIEAKPKCTISPL